MIYNTMSKQREVFKPLVPGKVGMYVCSHARAYVTFDVMTSTDYLHATAVLDDLMEPWMAMNNNLKKFKGKKQQLPLVYALIAFDKVKDILTVLGLMASSTCSEILQQLKD